MSNLTPIDRCDPHVGFLRAGESRRQYWREERNKANTFFLIGLILMGVSGYIGYLIGRY